MLRTWAPST